MEVIETMRNLKLKTGHDQIQYKSFETQVQLFYDGLVTSAGWADTSEK